jgi:hypothetical protein
MLPEAASSQGSSTRDETPRAPDKRAARALALTAAAATAATAAGATRAAASELLLRTGSAAADWSQLSFSAQRLQLRMAQISSTAQVEARRDWLSEDTQENGRQADATAVRTPSSRWVLAAAASEAMRAAATASKKASRLAERALLAAVEAELCWARVAGRFEILAIEARAEQARAPASAQELAELARGWAEAAAQGTRVCSRATKTMEKSAAVVWAATEVHRIAEMTALASSAASAAAAPETEAIEIGSEPVS